MDGVRRGTGKGGDGPAPVVRALVVQRISTSARQSERRAHGNGGLLLCKATSSGGSGSTPHCQGCLVCRKAHERWAVAEVAARDFAVATEGHVQHSAQRRDVSVISQAKQAEDAIKVSGARRDLLHLQYHGADGRGICVSEPSASQCWCAKPTQRRADGEAQWREPTEQRRGSIER